MRIDSRKKLFLIQSSLALLMAPLLLLPAMPAQCAPARGAQPSKVVILGFDGADARLVEEWMDGGKLPNLDLLRSRGCYSPLLPTNPPQTPVSWSTFSTGWDPGQHKIFDFLKRDPDTYTPEFAMMSESTKPFLFGPDNPRNLGLILAGAAFLILWLIVGLISRRAVIGLIAGLVLAGPAFLWARSFVERNVPQKQPMAINNQRGTPFWQVLGEHGITSTIIRVPVTFPPPEDAENLRLLSGLGVPDIRGTFGTYTYYTSAPFSFSGDSEKGGKIALLDVRQGDPSVETVIYGPFNKVFDDPEQPEILLPMTIDMDWGSRAVTLRFGGQEIRLKEGEWSDVVRLEFPIRRLVRISGITRFHLMELGPEVRLYMQAINLDPTDPIVPITYPKGFAGEIFRKIGFWKTLGWALDTWALDEEVTTEQLYMEDTDRVVARFEQIMDEFLGDPDDRLYVQIYYFTDRDGHMFWRFLDAENPAYDPGLSEEWGGHIERSYRHMDTIVGKAMAMLPPDGVLIILSDHGFSTWRRSFNINTWLMRNGYLTLEGQTESSLMTLDDLFVDGVFWPNVDWTRTRAYSLGLGAIYINVLGREREGIVHPGEEYDLLCAEIKEKLEAFVDRETGERPVHRVYRRDEMYREYDDDIPDLRAGNSLNYRVSWQTALGGIPPDYFEEHASKWSGDHCSLDPEVVKGIFLSNVPFDLSEEPEMLDMHPTILSLFDVAPGPGVYGRVLERLRGR